MAQREKKRKNRGSAGFNKKAAIDFLDKNRKKEGVFETSSGLQYQIIEDTSGDKPGDDTYLKIHQRCVLQDGKILADTYKENAEEEVKMEELIEGYQEGLKLMSKGSRYKFFVPPELAWGEKGTGNKIPPFALLIFDVRLVDFW